MTVKSSNVMARVEPEIKKQAEEIIENLGLTSSGVINMLYRQIIYNRGIPFSLTLPDRLPDMSSITKDEFDSMLETGYIQSQKGMGTELNEAFAKISEKTKQ